MTNSFKILRVGGIDIYVNWSWILAIVAFTWLLGDGFHGQFPGWSLTTAYVVGFISGVLLFATVLIHELAHSFVARANNLPVYTITLFIFGGVSNLTKEPQSPRIELLVALAGPLASLILSGLFYLLYLITGSAPSEIRAVLEYLAGINLILALFNLVPGFPLDGGRVLRAILWLATKSQRRATKLASNVGQGIGYLFIIGGLLEAFVLGQIGGVWLAFVGWFLLNAAGASYQQAAMDQVLIGVDVRDVMDGVPPTVGPGVSLEELVYRHMLAGNQRAVPVIGPDGQLIGLITLRDLNHVDRDRWPVTSVSQAMTPAARLVTVSPDEHLRQAMQSLAENNHHQLPVVEGSRLVGMLNRAHVLQYLHVRERLAEGTKTGSPPRQPTV